MEPGRNAIRNSALHKCVSFVKSGHDPEKACPARDAGWEPVFRASVIPGREWNERTTMCNCTSESLEIPGLVHRTIPE
jgi:hypothetical protein